MIANEITAKIIILEQIHSVSAVIVSKSSTNLEPEPYANLAVMYTMHKLSCECRDFSVAPVVMK